MVGRRRLFLTRTPMQSCMCELGLVGTTEGGGPLGLYWPAAWRWIGE